MRKQLIISLCILVFLALATTLVILYGRGYRFGTKSGKPDFFGTGLLVVTSIPDGAAVLINGHLTTATNNTINLSPGNYTVKIFKDGYFPWEKQMTIHKEVVTKAEALLFPSAPKLESITSTGITNPVLDPTQTKIAFTVASQSAQKNGVYVIDMGSRPVISLQNTSSQITDDTTDAFSTAQISWTPDAKNLLATISAAPKSLTEYLLDSTSFNQHPKDVTETLPTLQTTWEKDKQIKARAQMETLRPQLRTIVENNFNIISWSVDETKILYQATGSATIPRIITPPLIGANQTPEARSLEKDNVYVYDIKEDKNFKILDASKAIKLGDLLAHQSLQWFSDGIHLIYVHDKKIDIMEYDASNLTTIYAGPFVDNYVFPWPTGGKIVMLTNLNNESIPPNLYTVSLK